MTPLESRQAQTRLWALGSESPFPMCEFDDLPIIYCKSKKRHGGLRYFFTCPTCGIPCKDERGCAERIKGWSCRERESKQFTQSGDLSEVDGVV